MPGGALTRSPSPSPSPSLASSASHPHPNPAQVPGGGSCYAFMTRYTDEIKASLPDEEEHLSPPHLTPPHLAPPHPLP